MDYKSLIKMSLDKTGLTASLTPYEAVIKRSFILVSLILATIFIYRFLKSLDCDISLRLNEILLNYHAYRNYICDRVVWITGASSGIGEHLAYELVKDGARLVLSGRNAERLEKVKQNCLSKGHPESEIIVVPFDIKDREAHQPALDTVIEKFGKIDIFVNNAGTSQRSRFELIESRVDQDLFDNNVFGGVSLTRLLLKHWYKNDFYGHIVVTSCIVGKAALPTCASYTASKHAIHGYYECLRYEAAPKGIYVTVVCPGPVETNISNASYSGEYGVTVNEPVSPDRMSPERLAELMTIAIELRLEEVWISTQPFLWYCYAHQYFPTLSKRWLASTAFDLSQSTDQLE